MADMVVVRLIQSYKVFNPGETAGFPASEASSLVAAGLAVLLLPASPSLPPEPPRELTEDEQREAELAHLDLGSKSDVSTKDFKQPPKDKMLRSRQSQTK